ncbi:MAG: type II toxin-antitoxin system VapC family toxin [Dehalococcoidia bacterium]
MTLHLLDTDAVIDFLHGVADSVALLQRLSRQRNRLCTCDIVIAEVFSGLMPNDGAQGWQFLTALEFLPASSAASRQAGEWRYDYARRGTQLSTTDCLIAAIAVEHQAPLVTGNRRDFPMPELTVVPLPRQEDSTRQ